jgi:DNA primase
MIKEKYIDIAKSRVDIIQLVEDLCPEVSLKNDGQHKKKCCCVFHEESTPSLKFNSTLNRYKCFGCGKSGDVIQFVEDYSGLDFQGAVRYLLDTYCPDLDLHDINEKMTPEKEQEYRKVETMYIYNDLAYQFFRAQYEADNEEASNCRKYAEYSDDNALGRWDKDYCGTLGLGYSPLRGNQFLAYAKSKGLKMDILLELGLIGEDEHRPGNYYDHYRGRLMIPQRDKYGRILTFTARTMNPQASNKYLNGRDSLIYRKSNTVFGIDVAVKAARQSGKLFLVEGAPDVMRLQSIGISNVVATLGGSWSKEQLKLFSRFNCSLCFIPDSDILKEGKKFGAGEEFVFKNGRLAVEMGFHVSVRELPRGDGKNDPDSYITDLSRWETLSEKDFILWYTAKHYDPKASNEDIIKVISDVADILVHVQSDVLQSSILAELKDKYKKGSLWKTALADAARRLKEEKKRLAIKKSDELESYRFFRKGYHYYDLDQQGREREWTNFIIKPLFLIIDDTRPTRIFELENENRVRKTVELQQADVTKLERFKEQIEGKGNYRFFEKPDKYELMKAYIYEKTEEAQRIVQMGWNFMGEKGFYAFCNGIVYDGRWQPVDEFGIIRLENENFYLPAMSRIHRRSRGAFVNERRFTHDPKIDVSMKEYFTLIEELYGDNGVISICFYLATLFRDIIIDSTRSFPLLNIYGKKGTGKTEFAISIINLFQRSPEVSNLDSTTYYAMGEKCAEVSNMIVHFDEYKNSLSRKHIDFLKGIYDSAGRIKRSNDGEGREATAVDCGVLLTGQEIPTVDSALFSRVIFLESQKSERSRQETERFHKLMKLRNQHPTNITVELVKYRDNFNAAWQKAWKRALNEVKTSVNYNVIGERFINNWAMILASYYALKPVVEDLPWTEERIMEICINGLKYQHSLSSTSDEIAIFWAMFSKARQFDEIKEGQDYKIVSVKSLKVGTKKDPNKVINFDDSTDILFVREKICFAKANIQAKREGKTMIPDESLLSYLQSTPDYYGKTKSPMKFYVFDEQGEQKRRTNAKGESELIYDQERVLAFDYESICNNHDINLATLFERSENKKKTNKRTGSYESAED